MDIARSWALGLLASTVPLVLVLVSDTVADTPLFGALGPFLGGIVASATHSSPERERWPRHLLASLPPAWALTLAGLWQQHSSTGGLDGATVLVVGLLLGALGVAVVASGRRSLAQTSG